jgi:hypothetical protein
MNLDDGDACRELVRQLAAHLGTEVAPDFDFGRMATALEPKPVTRGREIGIVLTHGQNKWDDGHHSVYDVPRSLPKDLRDRWSFKRLDSPKQLLSPDLHRLPGLVVGSPWRQEMEAEVVAALTDWVVGGGRLLLLGFELGDRHHGGNLGDLARVFGISLGSDIVGPPGYGRRKPYGVPVDFRVADGDAHLLTAGLREVRLVNAQTVRVVPGGTEWLRVGQNLVYQPNRTNVVYRNRSLTMPSQVDWEGNDKAGWLPVAVEAPRGLSGAGAVQAIGTWDLNWREARDPAGDTLTLIERLFDWLSGEPLAGRPTA